MRKFIQSRSVWEIMMVCLLAFFATVGMVMAATTIGTDITTAGNIYATSTLLVDGASSFTNTVSFANTVTLSAANLKITTGYGLDTVAASGILNIGTTSATTINIGSTAAITAVGGRITVPNGYGLDSTGAVLNIGTTTATTVNIGSTGAITAIGGRITVPTGYSLDTAAASGILNIGTSTATTINIGSTGATVAIKGNMTFPTGYGIDTVGILNIGTTTATRINIGSATSPVVIANSSTTLANFGSGTTISGLLWGTCTVDPQQITIATSSLVSTSCNTSVTALTSTAGYKVFVTPPADTISADNWLVFEGATASTTGGYIEITLFNASTTANIDGPSRIWSWMAIK